MKVLYHHIEAINWTHVVGIIMCVPHWVYTGHCGGQKGQENGINKDVQHVDGKTIGSPARKRVHKSLPQSSKKVEKKCILITEDHLA